MDTMHVVTSFGKKTSRHFFARGPIAVAAAFLRSHASANACMYPCHQRGVRTCMNCPVQFCTPSHESAETTAPGGPLQGPRTRARARACPHPPPSLSSRVRHANSRTARPQDPPVNVELTREARNGAGGTRGAFFVFAYHKTKKGTKSAIPSSVLYLAIRV